MKRIPANMGDIINISEDAIQEFTIIDDNEYDVMTKLENYNHHNNYNSITNNHTVENNNTYIGESSPDYDDEHIDRDLDEELDGNYNDEFEEIPTPLHEQEQCIEDEDHPLSIESLMAMTPLFQDKDVVCIAARHLFLSKVKSQTCVKDVFFQNHRTDAYEYLVDSNWFDFETYAVLYICQVISKCHDPYKLHALIDGGKCDHHLNDLPECPEWKKVGFALYTTLFPDLVKDAETFTPFRAYLNSDRNYWARQLLDTLRDSRWLYKLMQPVITGKVSDADYNRDINILFVKLHLLDPTLVMPAYHYLQKALPDLNLEIATTNYLGGPLDWRLVKNEVEAVMYKPLYQRRVSKVSFESVEVYYGVELLEFIMKDPRDLELLTDKSPDNRRTTTFKDRCSIM